jgi:glycosyltransferase involved in cell wall biosynthesis
LATYGDGKIGFIRAAERLENEARLSGWFASVSNWSLFELQQLDPEWGNLHSEFIEKNIKGNGYWLWKPKLIQLMLEGLPENDILVYLDAGCEFNLLGQERFNFYVDVASKSELLAFYLNEHQKDRQVRQWTKKDLLSKFKITHNDQPILDAPQVEAGVLFIKNTPDARAFIKKWLAACESDKYSYLNDDASSLVEPLEFKQNRHDQAIFTLLLFKYQFGMILRNENYFPEFWKNDQHPAFAPIAAFRNATGTRKLEQMLLVKEIKTDQTLSVLNWFDRFNLFTDGTQALAHEILDKDYGQINAKNQSVSIITTLQNLKEKNQAFYRDRSNVLLKSSLNNLNLVITNLENNLIKKEEIIQGLKLVLDERLTALNEKEAVIGNQKFALNQRLTALNEKEKVIGNLKLTLDERLIGLNEKEEVIQSLKLAIFSLQEKNAYLEKNFISLWLDYRRIAKFIFPEKFLMPLRRLKHSIVHGSWSHEYGTQYLKRLQSVLLHLQHSILHSPLNFRKIYIGQLRHHEPKKNQNYSFVGKAIVQSAAKKSSLPTISIVTPSFNQGIYLENTINSIITQNYPHLDYWVQDGGSTDNSIEILQQYKSALAGYAVRNDAGQAEAVNLGFERSNGDIMAWVNSDDLLMPGSLQFVANFFDSYPEIDVLYGDRILINENSYEIGRWVLPKHDDHVLPWADYVPQETLFWRRQIWNKIGSSLDESFQFAMDWDLLLRFQAIGSKFCHVPQFLGCFRVHSKQKTSAQMNTLGLNEMDQLRKRSLGYSPSSQEIDGKLQSYYRKHIYADRLSRMKRLFYDAK